MAPTLHGRSALPALLTFGLLASLPACTVRPAPVDARVSFPDAGPMDAGPRDGGPDAGPRDGGPLPDRSFLDPDAACGSATVRAEVVRLPVDIIWMIDNSSSMGPAIEQVQAGLNDFTALIGASDIDYRVIMLSLRGRGAVTVGGSTRYAVCVPPPLAGDASCGDGTSFFQISMDVRSTQPFEQFLGTLGQTRGYTATDSRGGAPWRHLLRDGATRTIVMVSDDDSRLSPNDFEHFAGGTNPFNSNELPPGILEPSWGGLFNGYVFSGIYGWGSETDTSARCTFSDGTLAAKSGVNYTTLVTRTGGVRAQICDPPARWSSFFDTIATAVVRTSRIACEVPIPPPPDGMVLDPGRINVEIYGPGDRIRLRKVADAGACGPEGGWYYDDDLAPTEVRLCPVSCDAARARVEAGGTEAGVDVLFGCETELI